MEKSISATHARAHFGDLLRQVHDDGETFIVERGGQPAAAVIPMDTYRRLRKTSQEDLLVQARRLREKIHARRQGEPLPSPEEILRQIRQERDDELTSLR